MKKILFLLASIALVISACDPIEPSRFQQSDLEGLWGFSLQSDASAPDAYDEYLRLLQDGSFQYVYFEGDEITCQEGTWTLRDSVFTMTYTKTQYFFIYDDVLRIGGQYVMDNASPYRFSLLNFSKEKVELVSGNGVKAYLHAISQQPAKLRPELFEPAIPVTTQALERTWDHVNYYFVNDQGAFQWWYYYQPSQNGICLLPDGKMKNFHFWLNWIGNYLYNNQLLADDDFLMIYADACSWQLKDNKLIMSCSEYVVYNLDEKGDMQNAHTVTPFEPIEQEFIISTFTEHFMVLYCKYDKRSYVFSPGKDANAAPLRVSQTAPKKRAGNKGETVTMDRPLMQIIGESK